MKSSRSMALPGRGLPLPGPMVLLGTIVVLMLATLLVGSSFAGAAPKDDRSGGQGRGGDGSNVMRVELSDGDDSESDDSESGVSESDVLAGEDRDVPDAEVIEGSYIVVLHEDPVEPAITTTGRRVRAEAARAKAERVMAPVSGAVEHVFDNAVAGFSAKGLSKAEAARLAADPAVAYVEQDRVIPVIADSTPTNWGLDRIDQRDAGLNSKYSYSRTGRGVNIYVLDTGIRASHSEFSGRVRGGRNFTGDGAPVGGDCQGHGTLVAGAAAGETVGVAKDANIWDVRVLRCAGGGTVTSILAGIDWVRQNAQRPAVANMSFGIGTPTQAMDDAVANLIRSGIFVAAGAGNDNGDSCQFSPARVAFSVAASDRFDNQALFSNHGSCIDAYAPGVDIRSSANFGDTATQSVQGTSIAAPFVAGVAALYLEANPGASTAQVEQALLAAATRGAIRNPSPGTPNVLLYSGVPGNSVGPGDSGSGGGGDPVPEGWTACASEGQRCSFSGTAQVRYGADGRYVTRSATGGVDCTNATFGDPAPGVVKSCSYQSADTGSGGGGDPVPEGWTACASEGQRCSFSGTAQVRYGADGRYVTRSATGGIDCNNATFGDPVPGVRKACSYQPAGDSGSGGGGDPVPDGFTDCASEGERCSFSGTATVRYGPAYGTGQFVTKVATNGIDCTNAAFGGDPAPNIRKACSYQPVSGWTPCAVEGQRCNVGGPVTVRYGASGQYVTRSVTTGGIDCTNAAFGRDPAPNVPKACSYQP